MSELLKAGKHAPYKQDGKYALYGNPPRWHMITAKAPAPKGVPVAAHPHAVAPAHPVKHFSHEQWESMKLPDSNANAGSFNKHLDSIRAAADGGHISGLLGGSYGTNTYGKKAAAVANSLLAAYGSPHKVAPGQTAGEHPAIQSIPPELAEKLAAEKAAAADAPSLAEKVAEPEATKPAAAAPEAPKEAKAAPKAQTPPDAPKATPEPAPAEPEAKEDPTPAPEKEKPAAPKAPASLLDDLEDEKAPEVKAAEAAKGAKSYVGAHGGVHGPLGKRGAALNFAGKSYEGTGSKMTSPLTGQDHHEFVHHGEIDGQPVMSQIWADEHGGVHGATANHTKHLKLQAAWAAQKAAAKKDPAPKAARPAPETPKATPKPQTVRHAPAAPEAPKEAKEDPKAQTPPDEPKATPEPAPAEPEAKEDPPPAPKDEKPAEDLPDPKKLALETIESDDFDESAPAFKGLKPPAPPVALMLELGANKSAADENGLAHTISFYGLESQAAEVFGLKISDDESSATLNGVAVAPSGARSLRKFLQEGTISCSPADGFKVTADIKGPQKLRDVVEKRFRANILKKIADEISSGGASIKDGAWVWKGHEPKAAPTPEAKAPAPEKAPKPEAEPAKPDTEKEDKAFYRYALGKIKEAGEKKNWMGLTGMIFPRNAYGEKLKAIRDGVVEEMKAAEAKAKAAPAASTGDVFQGAKPPPVNPVLAAAIGFDPKWSSSDGSIHHAYENEVHKVFGYAYEEDENGMLAGATVDGKQLPDDDAIEHFKGLTTAYGHIKVDGDGVSAEDFKGEWGAKVKAKVESKILAAQKLGVEGGHAEIKDGAWQWKPGGAEAVAKQLGAAGAGDAPKDGDTKEGASGTLTFKNGRWHKDGAAPAPAEPDPFQGHKPPFLAKLLAEAIGAELGASDPDVGKYAFTSLPGAKLSPAAAAALKESATNDGMSLSYQGDLSAAEATGFSPDVAEELKAALETQIHNALKTAVKEGAVSLHGGHWLWVTSGQALAAKIKSGAVNIYGAAPAPEAPKPEPEPDVFQGLAPPPFLEPVAEALGGAMDDEKWGTFVFKKLPLANLSAAAEAALKGAAASGATLKYEATDGDYKAVATGFPPEIGAELEAALTNQVLSAQKAAVKHGAAVIHPIKKNWWWKKGSDAFADKIKSGAVNNNEGSQPPAGGGEAPAASAPEPAPAEPETSGGADPFQGAKPPPVTPNFMSYLGGNFWEQPKTKEARYYFNRKDIALHYGLKYKWAKGDGISSPTLNGEKISVDEAMAMLDKIAPAKSKLYYESGKIHTKGYGSAKDEDDVSATLMGKITAALAKGVADGHAEIKGGAWVWKPGGDEKAGAALMGAPIVGSAAKASPSASAAAASGGSAGPSAPKNGDTKTDDAGNYVFQAGAWKLKDPKGAVSVHDGEVYAQGPAGTFKFNIMDNSWHPSEPPEKPDAMDNSWHPSEPPEKPDAPTPKPEAAPAAAPADGSGPSPGGWGTPSAPHVVHSHYELADASQHIATAFGKGDVAALKAMHFSSENEAGMKAEMMVAASLYLLEHGDVDKPTKTVIPQGLLDGSLNLASASEQNEACKFIKKNKNKPNVLKLLKFPDVSTGAYGPAVMRFMRACIIIGADGKGFKYTKGMTAPEGATAPGLTKVWTGPQNLQNETQTQHALIKLMGIAENGDSAPLKALSFTGPPHMAEQANKVKDALVAFLDAGYPPPVSYKAKVAEEPTWVPAAIKKAAEAVDVSGVMALSLAGLNVQSNVVAAAALIKVHENLEKLKAMGNAGLYDMSAKPKEGDVKPGVTGMLVLQNGHWHLLPSGAATMAETQKAQDAAIKALAANDAYNTPAVNPDDYDLAAPSPDMSVGAYLKNNAYPFLMEQFMAGNLKALHVLTAKAEGTGFEETAQKLVSGLLKIKSMGDGAKLAPGSYKLDHFMLYGQSEIEQGFGKAIAAGQGGALAHLDFSGEAGAKMFEALAGAAATATEQGFPPPVAAPSWSPFSSESLVVHDQATPEDVNKAVGTLTAAIKHVKGAKHAAAPAVAKAWGSVQTVLVGTNDFDLSIYNATKVLAAAAAYSPDPDPSLKLAPQDPFDALDEAKHTITTVVESGDATKIAGLSISGPYWADLTAHLTKAIQQGLGLAKLAANSPPLFDALSTTTEGDGDDEGVTSHDYTAIGAAAASVAKSILLGENPFGFYGKAASLSAHVPDLVRTVELFGGRPFADVKPVIDLDGYDSVAAFSKLFGDEDAPPSAPEIKQAFANAVVTISAAPSLDLMRVLTSAVADNEKAIFEALSADEPPAKAPAGSPAGTSSGASTSLQQVPPETVSGWKKVGLQKGSNEGGIYQAPDGKQYYCKFPPDSDHARSEVLAGALYRAAGVEAAQTHLIKMDGKIGIASLWQPELKHDSALSSGSNKDVNRGFMADVWLGNRDVAGATFDNVMTRADGSAVRVDPGGSMFYRAQGQKKNFDGDMEELNSLLDPTKNHQTAKMFSGLTHDDVMEGAQKIVSITDSKVAELVAMYGPESDADKIALTQALIARKAAIAMSPFPKKLDPEEVKTAAPPPEPPPFDPKVLSPPPSFMNWNNSGSPGPSSKLEVNQANEAAVQAIFAAAQGGDVSDIEGLKFPVGGMMVKVLDYPSKHVSGYAKKLIGQIKGKVDDESAPSKPEPKVKPLPMRFATTAEAAKYLSAHAPKLSGAVSQAVSKLGKFLTLGLAPFKTAGGAMNIAKLFPYPIISYKGGGLKKDTYQASVIKGWSGLSSVEKNAIKAYTGTSYIPMNESLVKGAPIPSAKLAVAGVRKAMHPIKEGTVLSRKIDVYSDVKADILGSVGKILQENAVISTSINPHKWHGNVHLKIHVGPGVHGLYVGRKALGPSEEKHHAISVNSSEDELLLPAGTRFMVMKVEANTHSEDEHDFGGDGKSIIHVLALPNGDDLEADLAGSEEKETAHAA